VFIDEADELVDEEGDVLPGAVVDGDGDVLDGAVLDGYCVLLGVEEAGCVL